MGDDRAALNEALDESNRAACFGTGERAAAARARVHAEVDRLVEEAVTTEGRKWRRGMLAAQKREQESREDVDLLDWLEANAARYDANMFVMGILGDPNHRTLISRAVIRTARATDAARAASTEDGDVQNARDRAVIFDRSQTTGGLSLDECPMPGTTKGGTPLCCCGNCRRCGWPKHAAIHLAADGAERGSRPVGHRFKERRP